MQFIRNLKVPRTITNLRRILGIFQFYRRFNRNSAEQIALLNELFKGHTQINYNTPIRWTRELENSFECNREAYLKYTQLHYPYNDTQFKLTTDASKAGVRPDNT